MNGNIIRHSLAVIALLVGLTVAGSARASAQGCATVQVGNSTVCRVELRAVDNFGNWLSYVVNAGTPYPTALPIAPGFKLAGFIDGCGGFVSLNPNPCNFNVKLQGGCCADICYDPIACTLTITPVPGPCNC